MLYRRSHSSTAIEDALVEKSPSGEFYKFRHMGWRSRRELSHLTLLEVLGDEDDMCPNCVTPWKCNGPHRPCRGAPGGSPQLERYIDSLGLP